ncbi:MAG TPA: hypothetical protein P5305_01455 [Rubrivivax sp.]|nr:hypothetical protein [Rubrivivax sp.]HRY86519.1 hypothetical protein [Rubrivivax sp.]
MIITHTLKPSVDLAAGAILLEELSEEQLDIGGKLFKRHAIAVVHTRDQAIREALIKLGWTPPPEPTFPPAGGGACPRSDGQAAGEACQAKAERVANFDAKAAGEFMLRHLRKHGPTSSEILVEVCRIAGYKPHDDRAFGPVIASLARAGRMHQVGECRRRRGNGTAGGRIWGISLAPGETNR